MAYQVYSYFVKRILSGDDLAAEQRRHRTTYWNRLVEVERAYRAGMDAALGEHSAALAELEEAIAKAEERVEAAKAAIAKARQAARSKAKVPDELREASKAAIAVLKPLRERHKEMRAALFADPAVQQRIEALEEERRAAQRDARHAAVEAGLYWGNYLDVDGAYKAGRQGKGGRLLKFHAARREGTVSVWFQKGLPVAGVDGADSRLQIVPVPTEDAAAEMARPRGPKQPAPNMADRRIGRLRVGTGEERTPLYVEFAMLYHRPLPEHGVIRRASLVREEVASHARWRLLVVVNEGERKEPEPRDPIVGVDVGWRQLPNGDLRVACACTEEGEPDYLTLPARVVTAFEKADSLRAIRDRDLNANLAALVAWRRENITALPDWFIEATKTLSQWRSSARLAALVLRWRVNPFPGDEMAHDALEAWREHDKHLWTWEANERRNASARRREAFRLFAKRLAHTSGFVGLEKFNLRRVTGTDEEQDHAARMRVIASVGALRGIIRQTCARDGVCVKDDLPAMHTTITCWQCGVQIQFDARTELRVTCPTPGCGITWDQDENAARNLAHIAATGSLRAPTA